jgi:acetyl-CoA synthetase
VDVAVRKSRRSEAADHQLFRWDGNLWRHRDGEPILPLKPTAFSAPCPGIAADVFNEHGQPVRQQVGELVIKAPWIGMTRGFWHDPQRYLETYWSRWPDVWVHGDFAAVDADGQWYILGRSDDTIKIAGKRLGPAEVDPCWSATREWSKPPLSVSRPVKGHALVVLCVLSPGHSPSDELRGTARPGDRLWASRSPRKPSCS